MTQPSPATHPHLFPHFRDGYSNDAEPEQPPALCSFALGRGDYCTEPQGHRNFDSLHRLKAEERKRRDKREQRKASTGSGIRGYH